MTLQQFVTSNTNRALDFDGFYGAQCVDLVQFFNRDVVGGGRFTGNAKDIFGQQPAHYAWIKNTPAGVPPAGAILVWGAALGGGYGDVAICLPGATGATIPAFGQNYPYGSAAHVQTRNYSGIIGWGIPNVDVNPQPASGAGRWQAVRPCNVRSAPRVNAPLAGSQVLTAGQWFDAAAIVDGDQVGPENHWVQSTKGNFVWIGNLIKIG